MMEGSDFLIDLLHLAGIMNGALKKKSGLSRRVRSYELHRKRKGIKLAFSLVSSSLLGGTESPLGTTSLHERSYAENLSSHAYLVS